MSDLFAVDEASNQRNRPIELYDIALPSFTYYIASGNRNVLVGSTLYKAAAAQRSDMQLVQVSGNPGSGLVLKLPTDHPVVTRWFQIGVAPKSTIVTCWRKQERSGLIEKRWSGYVTSIAISDTINNALAELLIPEPVTDSMQRSLPMISAGPSCPHELYDRMCKVDKAAYKVSTTAILVTGNVIRVDTGASGHLGDWFEDGMLVHVASGETMTIAKQADVDPSVSNVSDLTIQLPILELKTGDAIEIYAGCKKGVAICLLKFNNKDNYGMGPDMPSKNPMVPTGFGTGE